MFPRFNVLGVGVHAVNLRQVLTFLLNAATEKRKGLVCLANTHAILHARKDTSYRDILNGSLLTIPDGQATVGVGHLFGYHCLAPFSAQQLISRLCRRSAPHGFRHFFYGHGDLQQLASELNKPCPELQVVGTAAHPGRVLTLKEETDLLRQVRDSNPDFFWVGLDSPEQEKFIASWLPRLNNVVVIAAGRQLALAGRDPSQPAAHGLAQLWTRYLVEYPKFAALLIAQRLGLLHCDIPGRTVSTPATYHLPRAA